jgi:HrpA-like RNA helicase
MNISYYAMPLVLQREIPYQALTILPFFPDPVPDYLKACVDTVIKISIQEPSGDVLVFLTGYEEVEATVRLLKEYANTMADSANIGFTFAILFSINNK